jgi:hypothetical protein
MYCSFPGNYYLFIKDKIASDFITTALRYSGIFGK